MKYSLDFLTDTVIGSAIRIHRSIGSGLLESVYELLLYRDLRAMGLQVVRQQLVTFTYHEIEFKNGFRIDLLVEERLLVEVKSIEQVKDVHKKQLEGLGRRDGTAFSRRRGEKLRGAEKCF